jgi:class 3 adenylate cyclase
MAADHDFRMRPLSLRFPEPAETTFRREHVRGLMWTGRGTIAVGVLAPLVVVPVMVFMGGAQSTATLWGVTIAEVMLATLIFGLTFTRWFTDHYEIGAYGMVFYLTAYSTGALYITFFALPSPARYMGYAAGVVFIMAAPYLLMLFPKAVLTASAVLLMTSLMGSAASGFDLGVSAVFAVILLTAFAVTVQAGRVSETYARQNFVQQRQLEAKQREVEAERRQSDRLLLNILPQPIAARLKQREGTIADSFAEVTVLFADVVDFTPLAAQLHPEEVVSTLEMVFNRLDGLAAWHGLEKIKTVGDAYMAVGGLPEPRNDHAEAAAELALDIQASLEDCRAANGAALRVRIGMDTGPVVAGVIGTTKFAYDLWGDTVNTASRMESHGIPARIQVTEATYRRLQDKYIFEPRGRIEVKGKGSMACYLLVASKEPAAFEERRARLAQLLVARAPHSSLPAGA